MQHYCLGSGPWVTLDCWTRKLLKTCCSCDIDVFGVRINMRLQSRAIGQDTSFEIERSHICMQSVTFLRGVLRFLTICQVKLTFRAQGPTSSLTRRYKVFPTRAEQRKFLPPLFRWRLLYRCNSLDDLRKDFSATFSLSIVIAD